MVDAARTQVLNMHAACHLTCAFVPSAVGLSDRRQAKHSIQAQLEASGVADANPSPDHPDGCTPHP